MQQCHGFPFICDEKNGALIIFFRSVGPFAIFQHIDTVPVDIKMFLLTLTCEMLRQNLSQISSTVLFKTLLTQIKTK